MTWTPFLPASSTRGRCLSIIRRLTSSVDPSSEMSALTWIRPPFTVLGMRGRYHKGGRRLGEGGGKSAMMRLPGVIMKTTLSTGFTGIEFENPFLLASAPPTESDSNIMRAFEAGWGGVVVKTIGMRLVINVKGPKTKFVRTNADGYRISMEKRPNTALHSSWNWELISDKPLDWRLPKLRRIQDAFPHNVLHSPIIAGYHDDKENDHSRQLAVAC